MAPAFRDGDALTVKSVNPAGLLAGQLVVIQEPGNPGHTAIRTVESADEGGSGFVFTTGPGPGGQQAVVGVSYVEVLGVPGTRFPYLGALLRSIRSADGYIFCVAIPGACALALIFMLVLSDKVEKAHGRTGVPVTGRAAGAHTRFFL